MLFLPSVCMLASSYCIQLVYTSVTVCAGINALVSFSGTLFRQLGAVGIGAALFPFVAFLVGNGIGSFVLVDKVGRRPILVWGMAAMAGVFGQQLRSDSTSRQAAGGVKQKQTSSNSAWEGGGEDMPLRRRLHQPVR